MHLEHQQLRISADAVITRKQTRRVSHVMLSLRTIRRVSVEDTILLSTANSFYTLRISTDLRHL